MGPEFHQGSVLRTPRLTLGPVDGDDGVPGRTVSDGSPFAPDGKACTAAAEKAARIQDGDEVSTIRGRWQAAEPGAVRRKPFGTSGERRSGEEAWFEDRGGLPLHQPPPPSTGWIDAFIRWFLVPAQGPGHGSTLGGYSVVALGPREEPLIRGIPVGVQRHPGDQRTPGVHWSGRLTVKRAPPPGSSSTVIVPWWRSMIVCATARPRPVPTARCR